MKSIRLWCCAVLAALFVGGSLAAQEQVPTLATVSGPVTADMTLPAHPRLLWFKGEEKALKKKIKADTYWSRLHELILQEADRIVELPVNERVKIGMRLLTTCREDLRRILYLGYAWRMTGDDKYAERAEREMLKASSFVDWNPSHYLDVGEMMTALAIGYDWFYDYLSPESRETIARALKEKGLDTADDSNWWLTAEHNWNQVCNAGVTYAALALYDRDPKAVIPYINRAIATIQKPMHEYGPDGAYPEGIDYWDYGTTYNVLFLSALEKAFGTDFDLSKTPGFMQTGLFSQVMITPALSQFNFSDNGPRPLFNPTVFWFYGKTGDPALLYQQKRLFETDTACSYLTNRVLPVVMLWGAGSEAPLSNPEVPSDCFYMGRGGSPVAIMRSSWDEPGAVYLAFKAGQAGLNHAHMDVGSFFLEAEGVRWALDLGGEMYNQLESRGVDLWLREQESQRWDVFRYRNQAHNTLTFNDKPQKITTRAEIDDVVREEGLMCVASDLSAVYAPQIARALRAVSLVNGQYAVIQDRLTTNRFTAMRWNMVTAADRITFLSDTTARLEKDGKVLYMRVQAPFPVKLRTWSTEPDYSFNSPNPGTQFVGFEAELPLNATSDITVWLMPGQMREEGKIPYDFAKFE